MADSQQQQQQSERPQDRGDVVREGSVHQDDHSDDPVGDEVLVDSIDRTGFKRNGLFVSYDQLFRRPGEVRAMHFHRRIWRRVSTMFSCQNYRSKQEGPPSQQIRIPPRGERFSTLRWTALWSEGLTTALQFWFNRTTFFNVILFYLGIYLLFITIFALLLYGIIKEAYLRFGFECCTGFNFDKPTVSENFDILIELSWTTFSTVGYGTVSVPPDENCRSLRYILAIEAFLGILFASLCGAIFFSKIVRLTTQAHVTFSSAICLQYGAGVTDAKIRVGSFHDDDDETSTTNFPVLEMRLVNDRALTRGGEIMSATTKCVVAATEEITLGDKSYQANLLQDNGEDETFRFQGARRTQKRVFSDFKVSPDKHPFFSLGVWYLRHSLDHQSPILKESVRKRIVELGGWPADLDSPTKIRDAFSENVDEILVTFKGTSNLTADTVFMKKKYSLSDIYIGWRFAGMVYILNGKHDRSGRGLGVDQKLLHDIIPALGEAYEPLGDWRESD